MGVVYKTLRVKTGGAPDPDPAALGSVFIPPEIEVWKANRDAKGAFFRALFTAAGTATVIVYSRDASLDPTVLAPGLWAVHGVIPLVSHAREFLQDDLGEHDFWVGFSLITPGSPPITLRVAELR